MSGAGSPLRISYRGPPRDSAHVFYDQLNHLLDEAGFERFVENLYAPDHGHLGRPGGSSQGCTSARYWSAIAAFARCGQAAGVERTAWLIREAILLRFLAFSAQGGVFFWIWRIFYSVLFFAPC